MTEPRFETTSFTPDGRFASHDPAPWGRNLTIAADQDLSAGTVLADNGSGELVPVDSSSGTTSVQTPLAVLAVDIDTTDGSTKLQYVYEKGHFRDDFLTFGGSDDVSTHREAMRRRGMFVDHVRAY